MTDQRPAFTHKPPRHGLIGPFTGRQLLVAGVTLAVAAIVLVAVTTPLGTAGVQPGPVDPRATPFVISSPRQRAFDQATWRPSSRSISTTDRPTS